MWSRDCNIRKSRVFATVSRHNFFSRHRTWFLIGKTFVSGYEWLITFFLCITVALNPCNIHKIIDSMSHWDVSLRKGCLLSVCVVGKFRILKLISLNKKRKTLFLYIFIWMQLNTIWEQLNTIWKQLNTKWVLLNTIWV